MTIADIVRSEIKYKLWTMADEIGWATLGPVDKARQYEIWTRDPEVGGQLSRYMDSGQVRVYIKDTLLKDYGRERMASQVAPYLLVGIPDDTVVVESYIKPHGRRFRDGRVLCWGRADDWKTVLMAVHERAFLVKRGIPFGAVLMFSTGRYHQEDARAAAKDAAMKLGLERLVWLD
jgi:hypothetical protein